MHKLVYAWWSAIAVVTTLLLILRLWFALADPDYALSIATPVIFIILLFLIFMLEGLQVSAIQINAADQGGVERYIDRHVPEGKRDETKALASLFRHRFDDFVVGRQLFTIISVVALSFFVQSLPTGRCPAILCGADQQLYRTEWQPLLSSYPVTFLIATLLPCWLSQLLPQFLADKRGIRFATLPFTSLVTRASLAIAGSGAGYPGHWLASASAKWLRFKDAEAIALGDEKFFSELVSYYGSYIELRVLTVHVAANLLKVADATTLAFRAGEHREIRHRVRAAGEIAAVKWVYSFDPETIRDLASEPETRVLFNYVAEAAKVEEKENKVSESTFHELEVLLERPLPLTGGKVDKCTLVASYECARTQGKNEDLSLYIDIERPTRLVRIAISYDDTLRLTEPEIRHVTLDRVLLNETTTAGQHRLSGQWKQTTAEKTRCIARDLEFPPLATRCLLQAKVLKAPAAQAP